MIISVATGADLNAVRTLLAACGLPVDDVREAPGTTQLVAEQHGALAGTVGVDVAGDLALLRSLAVAPANRGQGLGLLLIDAAERNAINGGARTLLMLTASAHSLAKASGFDPIDRCALGDGALVFRQLSAACCAGATCYVKYVVRSR